MVVVCECDHTQTSSFRSFGTDRTRVLLSVENADRLKITLAITIVNIIVKHHVQDTTPTLLAVVVFAFLPSISGEVMLDRESAKSDSSAYGDCAR